MAHFSHIFICIAHVIHTHAHYTHTHIQPRMHWQRVNEPDSKDFSRDTHTQKQTYTHAPCKGSNNQPPRDFQSLHSYVYIYMYRVAKTHRMPSVYRSFSAKESYIWWPFCEKRPSTQVILCIFATLYASSHIYMRIHGSRCKHTHTAVVRRRSRQGCTWLIHLYSVYCSFNIHKHGSLIHNHGSRHTRTYTHTHTRTHVAVVRRVSRQGCK